MLGNLKLVLLQHKKFLAIFFFIGYGQQTYDVFVTEIDADTGEVVHAPKKEIRHYEGNNANPDYSPDGKYLAYIYYRSSLPMGKNAICIYNLGNGNIQELYPESGNLSYPQWHPDGETISLEGFDKEGRKGIYLFDVKTGKVSPLVQIDKNEDIYAHRWSIDGKTLYYTKGLFLKDRTFRIFSHDVTMGKDRELPGSPDDARDIDISPDGEFIAFSSSGRSVLYPEIWVMENFLPKEDIMK